MLRYLPLHSSKVNQVIKYGNDRSDDLNVNMYSHIAAIISNQHEKSGKH